MAIFGWSTGKMATHYTRAAEKRQLAKDAAKLLQPAQMKNAERPHHRSGAGAGTKSLAKRGA